MLKFLDIETACFPKGSWIFDELGSYIKVGNNSYVIDSNGISLYHGDSGEDVTPLSKSSTEFKAVTDAWMKQLKDEYGKAIAFYSQYDNAEAGSILRCRA